MARNRRLACLIMDGGPFEFRRQLEYRARFNGSTIVVADHWFPSSKIRSCRDSVKVELALSQRTFKCDDCENEIGRDDNAARNLQRLAAGLRCQPVERKALARTASPRESGLATQEPDSIAA